MASNQAVVDELVVKLTLDAKDYKKNEQTVINIVNRTEVSLRQADEKQTKREKAAQKRQKDTLKGVKDLAQGLKSLTLTIGAMLGVGSAAGLVGAVVALAGMETSLRRAAVSTGLSNRELQAWGSTARRLGADAQAGASAIADLAREQRQFNLTGQAPTIQAFARLGVRVGPNTNIVDILSQAQQLYRQAAPAQRGQIESGLAAQGVSPDLIVAIKSEKDVREEFARSYQESAEENRKALDAVTDALTGLGNAAVSVANSIATVLQPYVEQFAGYVSEGAQQLSAFVDRVVAAGGGVDGFMKVLDEESPTLANLLRDLSGGLSLLGQTVDVVVYGFQSLYSGVKELFNWIDAKFGALTGGGNHQLGDAVGVVKDAVKWAWGNLVTDARREGAAPVGGLIGDNGGARLSRGAAARIAGGALGTPSAAGVRTSATGARIGPPSASAQDIMTKLVAGYGFSVDQAAAIAANLQGESGFFAGAFNPAGGGQGARGLAQWRGPRIDAFRKRYGVTPDQATVDQQLQFLATDPYERGLLNRALSGPGGAKDFGANVSRVFEGHGKVSEDLRRGGLASQYAQQFGQSGIGQQINIQSMTVQANNPQALVGGITRQSGVQNYNSAVQ